MYCAECKKRDTCRVLCSGAEAYVGQDHVSQREMTFSGMSRDNDKPEEDGGGVNIDLDDISFNAGYPHTWAELAGSPVARCRGCRRKLTKPIGPNQKMCKKCSAASKRRGWREAQRRFRKQESYGGKS
jgi:hypothetical protein